MNDKSPAEEHLRREVSFWLRETKTSQAEVARTLGYSAKHINGVLTGRNHLSISLAERILAVAGRRLLIATDPSDEA